MAATLLIEIPGVLLVLAPTRPVRVLGMQLQVLLQLMIIATGNYNFFNLLTIALCIPCLVTDSNIPSKKKRKWEELPTRGEVISSIVQYVCAFSFVCYLFGQMFR